MTKLLINETPLNVLPSLACLVGLEPAIILQQMHYWLNGQGGQDHDGCHWIYNSYHDWQRQFPFLSIQQVGRAIRHLEKTGYLRSATYNRKRSDRTKWYTIDYEKLRSVELSWFTSERPSFIGKLPTFKFEASSISTRLLQETTQERGSGVFVENAGSTTDEGTPISKNGQEPKARKVTEITEDFKAHMRERFSATLGQTVDERINEALAHKARLKYTDLQLYVQGWLRRDAERQQTNVRSSPVNGAMRLHERKLEVEHGTPPLREPYRP